MYSDLKVWQTLFSNYWREDTILRDNIAHIGHFHTAGNPGRNELDDSQELYYPAICRAIAATDYDGYVGQEFTPKSDAVAALEQAYKACEV